MIGNQFPWEIDNLQSFKPNLAECSLMALHMTINEVIDSQELITVEGTINLDFRDIEKSHEADAKPDNDSAQEPAKPSKKKLSLAERIRLRLLKIAEDLEIVTIGDE